MCYYLDLYFDEQLLQTHVRGCRRFSFCPPQLIYNRFQPMFESRNNLLDDIFPTVEKYFQKPPVNEELLSITKKERGKPNASFFQIETKKMIFKVLTFQTRVVCYYQMMAFAKELLCNWRRD